MDANDLEVQEAVAALSLEQFSDDVCSSGYLNGRFAVNFPLWKEKTANYAKCEGHQHIGFIADDGSLGGFAYYFPKDHPDFAADLTKVAIEKTGVEGSWTYLYLVLVSPKFKGLGIFEALYEQESLDSIEAGNVGCAIEIHRLNGRSLAAHRQKAAFELLGTIAVHERDFPFGTVGLEYEQLARLYGS